MSLSGIGVAFLGAVAGFFSAGLAFWFRSLAFDVGMLLGAAAAGAIFYVITRGMVIQ